MKKMIMATMFLVFCSFTSAVHAEEAVIEKASVAGRKVKRAVKKGANRVEEGLCGELTGDSKLSCMAKKVKNCATEIKDTVVDK